MSGTRSPVLLDIETSAGQVGRDYLPIGHRPVCGWCVASQASRQSSTPKNGNPEKGVQTEGISVIKKRFEDGADRYPGFEHHWLMWREGTPAPKGPPYQLYKYDLTPGHYQGWSGNDIAGWKSKHWLIERPGQSWDLPNAWHEFRPLAVWASRFLPQGKLPRLSDEKRWIVAVAQAKPTRLDYPGTKECIDSYFRGEDPPIKNSVVDDIWLASALACADLIDCGSNGNAEGKNRSTGNQYVFRNKGAVWEIAYNGHLTTVKNLKGMKYMHHLLSHPGVEIEALEMERVCNKESRSGRPTGDESVTADNGFHMGELDLSMLDKGDYDIWTIKAQGEVWKCELNEATDPSERADLRDKVQKLKEYLSSNENLLRNARPSGPIEKARKRVSMAINAAKNCIYEADPRIGLHFKSAVRPRGTAWAYSPDRRLDWQFS